MVLVLAVVPILGGALADDHRRARELAASGEILPLDAVVQRARAERPGELIEAELEREQGRYIYEIEMVDAQGRVWERRYDARTGEPIGERHLERREGSAKGDD